MALFISDVALVVDLSGRCSIGGLQAELAGTSVFNQIS